MPFSYLVPDASLLPPESVRFFYLDRNWTDALVEGVLSIGTFTSAERIQLEALREVIRAEVDETERTIRQPGGEERLSGPGGAISGFVMRSKLVSGWPGLHVRAYRTDRQQDAEIIPESDPDRLKVLRMERLAPAVLLVLFDGVPAVVHVEEPRQGIQFGALRPEDEPLSTSRELPLRDALDRGRPAQPADPGAVPPRQRRGDPHAQAPRPHRGRARDPRRRQQRPVGRRQRVRPRDAAVPVPPGVRRPGQRASRSRCVDVFRPKVSFALLEERFRAVIQP